MAWRMNPLRTIIRSFSSVYSIGQTANRTKMGVIMPMGMRWNLRSVKATATTKPKLNPTPMTRAQIIQVSILERYVRFMTGW